MNDTADVCSDFEEYAGKYQFRPPKVESIAGIANEFVMAWRNLPKGHIQSPPPLNVYQALRRGLSVSNVRAVRPIQTDANVVPPIP